MDRLLDKMPTRTRKTVITLVGVFVVLLGLIMVPYPGPGWLVVFMGLTILAREYPWAHRMLEFGRKKYDDWTAWLKRQNRLVQTLVLMITGVVIVLTIWLLNGYGLLNAWFNLGQSWLQSPFIR